MLCQAAALPFVHFIKFCCRQPEPVETEVCFDNSIYRYSEVNFSSTMGKKRQQKETIPAKKTLQ